MLDKLLIKFEDRQKKAFYAGDYDKSNLDLYFAFTGEPQTNPAKWNDTLKWGAGRGVEDQMGKILKDSGIVDPDYDQKTHGRVEMKKCGIQINGYIDFKSLLGNPIECKSINNANKNDIWKYEHEMPRESYVGQLANYMEFTGADQGALFVASIDGLHYFWIPCKRIAPGIYKAGRVTVDMNKEWQRWGDLYKNFIEPKIMPDIWQYRYKYDVFTLDWKAQSASAISKARNNHAVIGDWQISWSPWKNKIIELQGTVTGYTAEELAFIQEATKGYTTWPKKKKLTEEDAYDL